MKYENISCPKEECESTFKVAKYEVEISKAADSKMYCPKGHSFSWKDYTVENSRENFKEFIEDKTAFRSEKRELRQEKKKMERQLNRMNEFFAEHIAGTGVISLPNSKYTWKCSCGSMGTVFKNTEAKARNLYENHLENQHDGEKAGEYVCDCGEDFESQQAYASHCSRCELGDEE